MVKHYDFIDIPLLKSKYDSLNILTDACRPSGSKEAREISKEHLEQNYDLIAEFVNQQAEKREGSWTFSNPFYPPECENEGYLTSNSKTVVCLRIYF